MTADTMSGMTSSPGGYPVQVTFDENQRINRLWGIPFLGWFVRILLLIPHFIVLYVLQFAVSLSLLVSWIPVLLMGRQAGALTSLYVGTLRYTTRVLAWAFMLAGPYPPILPGSAPYPVNVEVQTDGSMNRLWGIPFLGFYLRAILVIPHAILVFILYFPVVLISLVIWLPILINGRMPGFGYTLYGGFLRLWTRTYLWVLLTPVPYPPIRI